jgi:Tfp pilus assembly protein PilN
MSPKIGVNLASEPFARTRPVIVFSSAAAVLLVGLFGLLIALSVLEQGQAAEARGNINRLEKQMQVLNREQARLEGILRQPENAEVLERSLFLNSLLYAKGISWTRLFDDLEKVMPHNVRLMTIRPQAMGQSDVMLDMVVGAENPGPVVEMFKNLESSPMFKDTLVHNSFPPTQTEPLLRYRVSVSYAQKL